MTGDWTDADWRKWAIEMAVSAGAAYNSVEYAADTYLSFVFPEPPVIPSEVELQSLSDGVTAMERAEFDRAMDMGDAFEHAR